MLISYPDKEQEAKTLAIEDIGVMVLANQQIIITNGLLEKLIHNNVALINCDQQIYQLVYWYLWTVIQNNRNGLKIR